MDSSALEYDTLDQLPKSTDALRKFDTEYGLEVQAESAYASGPFIAGWSNNP